MAGPMRLSHQALRILRIFLNAFSENVRHELTGSDLMKSASMSSGTLYPILLRMEKAGVLVSRWEQETPEELRRPRRRYYRLSPAGARLAQDALHELSTMANPLPDEA